jgi:hypothetical protein
MMGEEERGGGAGGYNAYEGGNVGAGVKEDTKVEKKEKKVKVEEVKREEEEEEEEHIEL